MVQEEDRGQPADDELMFRSQGSNTEPSGEPLKIGAVLEKDSGAPKSRLAEQSGGPSGKSRSLGSVRRAGRVAGFDEASGGGVACRDGPDEGEVRQAAARGGHVRVRERGALRARPLQRRHQPRR